MFIIFFLLLVLTFLRFLCFKGGIIFYTKNNIKKYECRYNEIDGSNLLYSAQFFILALSFILFDLEIVFFVPYFILNYYSLYITYILFFFLLFLLFRLYYELTIKIV